MSTANVVDDDPVLEDLPDDPDNILCQAERMISLSAPRRQPIPVEDGLGDPLATGYHYFGPHTFQDSSGVRGRFTVVDPLVCDGGCGSMFALDHVYAQDPGAPQRWMEAGWAEVEWQLSNRYVFEFDSADMTWNFFDQLSTGTQLSVRVRNTTGNTWRSEREVGGSWVLLREKDLGFSIARDAYNKGEVWTPSWHPDFPSSTFNQGYLLISGIWRIWDTRYSTVIMTTDTYDTHMSISYYYFCIHYHWASACTPSTR